MPRNRSDHWSRDSWKKKLPRAREVEPPPAAGLRRMLEKQDEDGFFDRTSLARSDDYTAGWVVKKVRLAIRSSLPKHNRSERVVATLCAVLKLEYGYKRDKYWWQDARARAVAAVAALAAKGDPDVELTLQNARKSLQGDDAWVFLGDTLYLARRHNCETVWYHFETMEVQEKRVQRRIVSVWAGATMHDWYTW